MTSNGNNIPTIKDILLFGGDSQIKDDDGKYPIDLIPD